MQAIILMRKMWAGSARDRLKRKQKDDLFDHGLTQMDTDCDQKNQRDQRDGRDRNGSAGAGRMQTAKKARLCGPAEHLAVGADWEIPLRFLVYIPPSSGLFRLLPAKNFSPRVRQSRERWTRMDSALERSGGIWGTDNGAWPKRCPVRLGCRSGREEQSWKAGSRGRQQVGSARAVPAGFGYFRDGARNGAENFCRLKRGCDAG